MPTNNQFPISNQVNAPGVKSKKYITEFYIYSVEFDALLSGTTATGQIPIQADSDFILQKLTQFSDIAAAAQTANTRVVPLVSALITDTGSSRQLMDRAIPLSNMFGIAEVPFILPAPRNFRANSVINIQLTNFDAAADYNVKLAFIGHKVYGLRS